MKDAPQPRNLDRWDGLIALAAAAASLALYARTLVPGLLPGDGGEFQTLAFTVDHAHTTGYEVYVLLAKLFTLLVPLGEIAHRVNLLSAVYGALTVGFVFLAGRALTGSRWAGLLGAAALATSATFWSQSIIAEVYTAGSAFTSAILLLVLLWYTRGQPRYLAAAGVLGGLGIGVHGSNSLFAPAIVVLVLLTWLGRRCAPRTWLAALVGALVGLALLVAAFVVVDSHNSNASILNSGYRPSISRWDEEPSDLQTIGGRFTFLVFARQWRSAMFSDPAKIMPRNLGRLARTLPQDFTMPVLALMALGLVSLFLREWRLGVFFTLALAVHQVYSLNYSIGDIYVFYVSLYVYLAALAAEGAAVVLRIATKLADGLARPAVSTRKAATSREGAAGRYAAPGSFAATAAAGLVLLALAVLPILPLRAEALQQGELRFDFMDLPSNQALADWRAQTAAQVAALPPDAVVLTDWYHLYGFLYVAQVEQNRPKMQFIESYPYSTKPGMAQSLFIFLHQKLAQGVPVFSIERLGELQNGRFQITGVTLAGSRFFSIQNP